MADKFCFSNQQVIWLVKHRAGEETQLDMIWFCMNEDYGQLILLPNRVSPFAALQKARRHICYRGRQLLNYWQQVYWLIAEASLHMKKRSVQLPLNLNSETKCQSKKPF